MSKKRGDKIPYKSHNYITKEGSPFQFNLKLGGLVNWVICFCGNRSFVILGGSLSGHDNWSQVLLKALGSYSYFWNHCSLVRRYFLGSTRFFWWPLLTGKMRILRLHFFNWISNCRSHFSLSIREARGSNGRGVKYISSFLNSKEASTPAWLRASF